MDDAYLIDEENRILAEENERFERTRVELGGGIVPDPTDDEWDRKWTEDFERSTREWEERN